VRRPDFLGEVMRAQGKRERGKRAATKSRHHPVKLLVHSFLGGKQRSGGAASFRGAAMAAVERALGCWGLGLRRRRLQVGAARARVRTLNRGSGGSWACGPEAECGGDGAGVSRTRVRVRVRRGGERRA
jgi:hypothetical protein